MTNNFCGLFFIKISSEGIVKDKWEITAFKVIGSEIFFIFAIQNSIQIH